LFLKAKFEGGSTYYSFKRLVPGAFKMDFIGSTCTALPSAAANASSAAMMAAGDRAAPASLASAVPASLASVGKLDTAASR
jgi:hypothetical protein